MKLNKMSKRITYIVAWTRAHEQYMSSLSIHDEETLAQIASDLFGESSIRTTDFDEESSQSRSFFVYVVCSFVLWPLDHVTIILMNEIILVYMFLNPMLNIVDTYYIYDNS